MFQMVDPQFDNHDNPYLRFHFFMKKLGKDGVQQQIEIPVIKC